MQMVFLILSNPHWVDKIKVPRQKDAAGSLCCIIFRESTMNADLKKLVEKARATQMSSAEREEQRVSFVYGNTKFENPNMTRETVVRASQKLKEDANGTSTDSAQPH